MMVEFFWLFIAFWFGILIGAVIGSKHSEIYKEENDEITDGYYE